MNNQSLKLALKSMVEAPMTANSIKRYLTTMSVTFFVGLSAHAAEVGSGLQNFLDGKFPTEVLQSRIQKLDQATLEKLMAAARGGDNSGGGDEVGLKFQGALASGLLKLQQTDSETFAKIQPHIEKAMSKARFVVVDNALDVGVKDLIQNSVAVNFPDAGLVLINRARWTSLKDSNLEEGISMHEVFSLAKLEQSGSYPYSARYIAIQNGSVAQFKNLVTVDRVKQIKAENIQRSSYEILKTFFEEAMLPATIHDFDPMEQNRQSCVVAANKVLDLLSLDIGWKTEIASAAKPAYGPLIAAKEATYVTYLYYGIGAYVAKIEDLRQASDHLEGIGEGRNIYPNMRFDFKKNNSMTAFRIYNSRFDSYEYGYCYPKK